MFFANKMFTPYELSAVQGKISSEQEGVFVPYEESCWLVGSEFTARKEMCRNCKLSASHGERLHSPSPE